MQFEVAQLANLMHPCLKLSAAECSVQIFTPWLCTGAAEPGAPSEGARTAGTLPGHGTLVRLGLTGSLKGPSCIFGDALSSVKAGKP